MKSPFAQRPSIVLSIGDDAIVATPFGLDDFAPRFAEAHDPVAVSLLLSQIDSHPTAEIILLADNLAQDYRVDSVPPLNPFDRSGLMKRRLKQAFPQARLSALLKAKSQRDQVLLIGVHESNQALLWADKLSPRLPSIALLPVEAARLLPRLMPQAAKGWAMMISLNRTGGFRQVVTKDGDLVFTRLTPAKDASDALAATIQRDLRASLDYLGRLGLPSAQDLSVLLLLPEDKIPQNALAVLGLQRVETLSPYAAAQMLRLPTSPEWGETTSDTLFAAATCRRGKIKLPLMLPAAAKQRTQNLIKFWGDRLSIAALSAAFLFFLISASGILTDFWQTQRDNAQAQSAHHEWAQLKDEAAPLTEPLGRLRHALARRRVFDAPTPEPWQAITQIAEALPSTLRLMKIDWRKDSASAPALIALSFDLAAPEDRADAIAVFNAAARDMAQKLGDSYDITIERMPFPGLPADAVTANAAAGYGTMLLKGKPFLRGKP